MTHDVGQLTSTELDKTIAAAEWLVGIASDGLLDRSTWTKVATLLAECRHEDQDRAAAARHSRAAAKAALTEERESGKSGNPEKAFGCACGFEARAIPALEEHLFAFPEDDHYELAEDDCPQANLAGQGIASAE